MHFEKANVARGLRKTHLFIVKGLQHCETLHCACLLMGFAWAQLGACL